MKKTKLNKILLQNKDTKNKFNVVNDGFYTDGNILLSNKIIEFENPLLMQNLLENKSFMYSNDVINYDATLPDIKKLCKEFNSIKNNIIKTKFLYKDTITSVILKNTESKEHILINEKYLPIFEMLANTCLISNEGKNSAIQFHDKNTHELVAVIMPIKYKESELVL